MQKNSYTILLQLCTTFLKRSLDTAKMMMQALLHKKVDCVFWAQVLKLQGFLLVSRQLTMH